jgi:hypothetical protein
MAAARSSRPPARPQANPLGPGLARTAPAQVLSPEPAGSSSDSAREWAYSAPVESPWGPPHQADPPLDPAAATGPPWPRLVASGGVYTPPRLVRWPIVLGALLFAWWIASSVVARVGSTSNSPSSAPPYVFTASDAQFTATFPGQPQRTEKTLGTTTLIFYQSTLSDHAVGVGYLAVPASGTFSLDGGVTGAATGAGGKVLSRTSLPTRAKQPRTASSPSQAAFFSSGSSNSARPATSSKAPAPRLSASPTITQSCSTPSRPPRRPLRPRLARRSPRPPRTAPRAQPPRLAQK